MAVGGEAVDHRHPGRRGKPLERRVRVGTDHDGIDIAGEHARGILGRFARAHHELGAVREKRRSAQAADRDFERDARAKARFFEKQRHGAPAQQSTLLVGRPSFKEVRQAQNSRELLARQVAHSQEMAAQKARRAGGGWRRGMHVLYIYAYDA
jgi:hypothetical protein